MLQRILVRTVIELWVMMSVEGDLIKEKTETKLQNECYKDYGDPSYMAR